MVSVPEVEKGRSAWTTIGKDNDKSWYGYIAGEPLDGGQPDRDVNYQAVNLGVQAIQRRIMACGFPKNIVVDGVLGRRTNEGILWVQDFFNVAIDGQLGRKTATAMFRPFINKRADQMEIPRSHLWGMCNWESGCDPGAVGGFTPTDRSFFQINVKAHPELTVEEIFNFAFCSQWAANDLALNRIRYGEKGEQLKDDCSIAHHNSPKSAREWYETGQPPTQKIADYVMHVKQAGQQT